MTLRCPVCKESNYHVFAQHEYGGVHYECNICHHGFLQVDDRVLLLTEDGHAAPGVEAEILCNLRELKELILALTETVGGGKALTVITETYMGLKPGETK